jgi:hypothetical protein
MIPKRIDHMFNFTFEKTTAEIVTASTKKAMEIRNKIEERGLRIKKMRDEHKVTDAVLLDIQNQMRAQQKRGVESQSYTSNARSSGGGSQEEVTVGAGVINFLLTEQDYIDAEKAEVEKLDAINRNLKDITAYAPDGTAYIKKFTIGYDELKYLGF